MKEVLTTEEVLVNGEPFYVLDFPSTERLIKYPWLGNKYESVQKILQWTAEFVCRHYERFRLSWHLVGQKRKFKLWVVLLKVGEQWVRVHLEGPTCVSCKTRLLAATTEVSDLYLGLVDRYKVRDEVGLIPCVPCPRCGGKIGERYIWSKCLMD